MVKYSNRSELLEYFDKTCVGLYANRERLHELNNRPVPTGYGSWVDYWRSL